MKIVSDLVRAKEFELGTQSQAIEIILNLSEKIYGKIRKIPANSSLI